MDADIQSHPARGPGWNYLDLLIILGVLFVATFVAGSVGFWLAHMAPALAGLTKEEVADHPFFLVPVQAATYLITFVFVRMHITVKAQRDFWEAVSWEFPSAAVAVQCVMSGFALAVMVLIATTILPVPPDLPVEKYFRVPGAMPLLVAFTVLVAPFAEELFFRGLLYPVLVRSLGVAFGIILTSLLFASLHIRQLAGAWSPLLVLFSVGAALTFMRYRRRSVAASWLMHASYNGTLMLVMFVAKGGFEHMTQ